MRNLIENALELSWTIFFIFLLGFNKKLDRKCSGAILDHVLYIQIKILLEIEQKMFWISLVPFLYVLYEIYLENALELPWAIFFIF